MNNTGGRSILNLDLGLIGAVFSLMVIGILFVYSSGVNTLGTQITHEFVRQVVWATLGLTLIFLLAFINYTIIQEMTIFFYIFFILLLVVTLLFGRVVNNSRSWLGIWGLGIQPSEFMKVAYVLFLSSFYASRMAHIRKLSTLLIGLVLTAIPVALIMRQPDLGTALVFFPIFLAVSFLAGVPRSSLFFISAISILTALFGVLPLIYKRFIQEQGFLVPILTENQFILTISLILLTILVLSVVGWIWLKKRSFFWIAYATLILLLGYLGGYQFRQFLREYQIMRLVTFLNPNVDPLGAGWNIIQSLNAVGSGGLMGKGFLQGTQSQLRYIPMQSTDFIFSIISEEWGFVGGILILALYGVILWRGALSVMRSRDMFGTLICSGFLMMLFFHLVLNVGMNIGIMPITGIPLLLISYGGSSMLAASMALGLILSVQRRRFLF